MFGLVLLKNVVLSRLCIVFVIVKCVVVYSAVLLHVIHYYVGPLQTDKRKLIERLIVQLLVEVHIDIKGSQHKPEILLRIRQFH